MQRKMLFASFFLPAYTDVKTSTVGVELSSVVFCRLFMISAGHCRAAEVRIKLPLALMALRG